MVQEILRKAPFAGVWVGLRKHQKGEVGRLDINKRRKFSTPEGKGEKMILPVSNESRSHGVPWSRKDSQENRKEIPLPLSVVALRGPGSSHWPNSTEKGTSFRDGLFRVRSRGGNMNRNIYRAEGRGE